MRYLAEIAFAVCFLLVSSAAAASSWQIIEGTKNINGNISIKCEAGSGWRKCGEDEPKDKIYLLGFHTISLNGNKTMGFIHKGKILETPSGVEVRCYSKVHAAQYNLKGVQICEDFMDGIIAPGFTHDSNLETLFYTYKLSSAPLSKDVITCSTLYPYLGVSPFPNNKAHPYFQTCGSDLVNQSVKSNLVSKEYGINRNYKNIILPQPTISIELNSSKGKRYKPVRLAAIGASLAINHSSSSTSFAYELEEVK